MLTSKFNLYLYSENFLTVKDKNSERLKLFNNNVKIKNIDYKVLIERKQKLLQQLANILQDCINLFNFKKKSS